MKAILDDNDGNDAAILENAHTYEFHWQKTQRCNISNALYRQCLYKSLFETSLCFVVIIVLQEYHSLTLIIIFEIIPSRNNSIAKYFHLFVLKLFIFASREINVIAKEDIRKYTKTQSHMLKLSMNIIK